MINFEEKTNLNFFDNNKNIDNFKKDIEKVKENVNLVKKRKMKKLKRY